MDVAELQTLLHADADGLDVSGMTSRRIVAAVRHRRRRRIAGAITVLVGAAASAVVLASVAGGRSAEPAQLIPTQPSPTPHVRAFDGVEHRWTALITLDVQQVQPAGQEPNDTTGWSRHLSMTGELITGLDQPDSPTSFDLQCQWPISQEASTIPTSRYTCTLEVEADGATYSSTITMDTSYFQGFGTFELPADGGVVDLSDLSTYGALNGQSPVPRLDRTFPVGVTVQGNTGAGCVVSTVVSQRNNGDGTVTYVVKTGTDQQSETLPDENWNSATASDALIARLGLPARPTTNVREADGVPSVSTSRDEWVRTFANINTPPKELLCHGERTIVGGVAQ